MNTTDVRGTLREMWETRPARPRDDRQIAGVAAGIARRYDIDPVLVRVGFVVAAFFGIGAALYIVGWIVLPDTPADPAVPEGRKRAILVVGLGIATIVSIGSIFGGRGGFILPLLAVVALLFLLHRSRADRGPAGIPPSWPPQQQPTEGVSLVKGVSKEDAAAAAVVGPAGRRTVRLGPARAGPGHAAPAAPAPPHPVTLVTLGLALLAGAGTGVVLLTSGVAGLATFPVLLGVVAAVLGLGLVVGSFLRAGRGLIPFAVLVSALIWGALSAPWHRFGPRRLRRPAGRADDRGPAAAGVPARCGRRDARPARARPLRHRRRADGDQRGRGRRQGAPARQRRRDVHRRSRAGRRQVRRPQERRARSADGRDPTSAPTGCARASC